MSLTKRESAVDVNRCISSRVLWVIILSFFISNCSIREENAFFVEEAEFFFTNDHIANFTKVITGKRVTLTKDQSQFGLRGHFIKKGAGHILAFRDYYADRMKLDSAGFVKVTIYFPPALEIYKNNFDFSKSKNIIGFVSSGSSHFPDWAPLGYIRDGTISIRKINGNKIEVDVDIRVTLLDFLTKNHYGDREKSVKKSLVLTKKALDSLTAWDGKFVEDLDTTVFPN